MGSPRDTNRASKWYVSPRNTSTVVIMGYVMVLGISLMYIRYTKYRILLEKTRILEEFEDTKGAIRNHISKKNRQHNGQKKKVQEDKQR